MITRKHPEKEMSLKLLSRMVIIKKTVTQKDKIEVNNNYKTLFQATAHRYTYNTNTAL